MMSRGGITAAVLVLFAASLVLASSGRLASGDAGTQLQATMLLATTGDPGAARAPAGPEYLWVRSADGRFYQAHDVGSLIVMLPAALAGSLSSSLPDAQLVDAPPLISRVATALTYALLSAVGCTFLFLLFARRFRPGPALLLAAGLPLTTIFGAYTKASWDVLGAACCVCAVLYFAHEVMRGHAPRRSFLLLSAAIACAGLFRFSLLPFLGLVVAIAVVRVPAIRNLRTLALGAATGLVVLLPELVYNQIRMGSPLRPATTAPQYTGPGGANEMGNNPLEGLAGLLAAPNRGLLVFSPIFLLLLALPFVWRRMDGSWRRLLAWFGPATLLYALLIASLENWGAFGWGPRYLLPVVPVLYVAAVAMGVELWARRRAVVAALVGVSLALSVPPLLVNWSLASATGDRTVEPTESLPRQQLAVWSGLARGVRGEPLALAPELLTDPDRAQGARFPDLWLVRLAERSRSGALAALVLAAVLLLTVAVSLRRILRGARPAPAAAARVPGAPSAQLQ